MILTILINLLIFFNLLSIGLPIIIDFIILGFLIYFVNKNKLIFLNTNIFFFILLLSISIFSTNQDNTVEHYRGHEKFYQNKFSYKINIKDTLNIPHGDLIAVDICLDDEKINQLKVKRKQKFITDKYGFRNSKIDLSESDLILVGDSQISGSSLTDEFLLSSQLNKISNLKTVNLSVGGANPLDYEKIIQKNYSLIKKDAKLLVFYFEGNDFILTNKSKISKKNKNNLNFLKLKFKSGYEKLERNKDKFFLKIINYNNFLYKKIRPKSQRIYFRVLAKWTNSCPVKYKVIGNDLVGFYWLESNLNNEYKTYIIKDPLILEKIHKVFLIPTKSRVYENLINNITDYKSNKINFLKKSYNEKNIEVIDLTIMLKKEAKKYLENNEHLFFRDDTHLNQNGTYVIANFIKNNL